MRRSAGRRPARLLRLRQRRSGMRATRRRTREARRRAGRRRARRRSGRGCARKVVGSSSRRTWPAATPRRPSTRASRDAVPSSRRGGARRPPCELAQLCPATTLIRNSSPTCPWPPPTPCSGGPFFALGLTCDGEATARDSVSPRRGPCARATARVSLARTAPPRAWALRHRAASAFCLAFVGVPHHDPTASFLRARPRSRRLRPARFAEARGPPATAFA
mmetsp:Transcript_117838/g.337912  ORF Transcript_117838/g.337912 Transcript_117838/m.337912 type:complete len:220 (-) Transcript_117838:1056-1715(-)